MLMTSPPLGLILNRIQVMVLDFVAFVVADLGGAKETHPSVQFFHYYVVFDENYVK